MGRPLGRRLNINRRDPSNRGLLAISSQDDLEAAIWFMERRWSGMTGNSGEDDECR